MSMIKDENNIVIPIDILNYYSKNSNVNTDELIDSYITGFLKSQKEMNKKQE